MTAVARTFASRRQPGFAELGIVVVLYAAYELLRGLGDASVTVARDHAGDIVALERWFNVFFERAVQDWASGLPALPSLLGIFYVTSHFGLTTVALVWMHRSHPARFPLVRNTLVLATALSLVGYIVYPAAPPRLSGHGFADTLIVGAVVFAYARRPLVRALGVLYPPVMLFDIVATGNHFLFDAAMGGLVVLVAVLAARLTVRTAAPAYA